MPELILPKESPVFKTFSKALNEQKMVLFAGLPGVGKSLYLQQLSIMAQQANRGVHLLQWDVTRAAFETPDILTKYPEINGVTHAGIRKAVGLWARQGLKNWHDTYKDTNDILIGEVPLIGNRLIELVQKTNDAVEPLLASEQTLFVLPVPSKRIRANIEQARAKSISKPKHERENADAPPNVLTLLWQDLHKLALQLGIIHKDSDTSYNPNSYASVYEQLMQHRNQITLHIDEDFGPSNSVYDLNSVETELAATPNEVTNILKQLEKDFTEETLERSVANWFET